MHQSWCHAVVCLRRWYSLCSFHLRALSRQLLRSAGGMPAAFHLRALKATFAFHIWNAICFLFVNTAINRDCHTKKQPSSSRKEGCFSLVPVVGLEPTRRVSPQDFESSASASFTTPANKNTLTSVFGDPPEIRTPDHRIKSAVLYRLS